MRSTSNSRSVLAKSRSSHPRTGGLLRSELAAAGLTSRLCAGDKRLFIRNDELDAAWQLFTPVLQAFDEAKRKPEQYPYGSRGPIGAHYLAAKYGVRWGDDMENDE